MRTINELQPDVIDLTLWGAPPAEPAECDEAPSGAAAALAFVAFLGFAAGLGAAAVVVL